MLSTNSKGQLRNKEKPLDINNLKKDAISTLKLTLLHYGSLKEPRLPIPLYGADAIAYRLPRP